MTTRAFAYYRLPHQQEIHLVRQCGETAPVSGGFSALDGVRGFVIAPFCLSDDCPMCWIQPDEERLCDTPDEPMMRAWCDEACAEMDVVGDCVLSDDVRMEYSRSFNSFHQAVCQGRFEKLVLARQDVQRDHGAHPVILFLRACECYPRMFISLFYTPQCGLWLTATPEILLEREDEAWHTVALAGTMRNHDNDTPVWSMKNRGEQLIVSDYVARLLGGFADSISQTEPQTTHAAHLLHLRTDFRFTLREGVSVGSLVEALHPTPAVCGLPKEAARAFILGQEPCRRHYYSGFSGPWQLQGGSHLFVSLRCMTRLKNWWRLFAGGGIVPDSEESAEWHETEEKLLTMRRLIRD